MLDVLTGLFDPTGFPPRKDCGPGWTPGLIWLHVTSDLFIWLAYVSIPLVLLYFTRLRSLPFPRLFVLFALFILACGTTHLLDALIFEYPVYRFAGVMKAVTAVVSWATVIALVPLVPRVMLAVAEANRPGADTKLHRPLPAARPGRTREYIVAVLAAVLAILVRAALDPLLKGDHIFVVALLAVVYVSWQYGFGPGVVCLVVGVSGYAYLFVSLRTSEVVPNLGAQVAVALFFFCGIACAALGESHRTAQRRARAALATTVARREELESEVVRRRVVETALRQREAELVAAQRETAEALARLNAFLDNAPVGIAFFDPDLRYVRVNAFLAEANGKPIEAHTGRRLPEVLPDFPPDVLAAYRRTAGPNGVPFTTQFRRPDRRTAGATRAWYVTAFPVRGADGAVMGAGVVAQDVTDRRKAEEELQRSERNLSDFFENANVGLHWVGPDGIILRANTAELELLGYARNEYVGRSVTEFHDDPDAICDILTRLKRGERLDNYPARLRCKDGTTRDVLISSSVLFEDGRFVHSRCFTRDVTEVKRATGAMRESEERFRSMADSAPALIWLSELDGRRTYFNKTWLEFTGRPLEQEVGYGWADNIHPDDRAGYLAIYTAAVADRHPFELEYRLRRRDGTDRWVVARGTPRFTPAGAFAGFVGLCLDVTDRRQATEAMRESEAFRRSVFENSPDCLMIIDLDGRVLEVNEGGCRLMEVDDFPAIRGSAWADLWPAANRETVREAVAAARAGRVGRFQGFCPTPKGTPKYWDVSVAGVPGADGRPFRLIGVSRDVTEERRTEERVRESEERFRQLAESIPQLAWMTDADGSIFWYNQRWYDYTGTTFDEMKGWGWESVHDPAELPRVVEKFKTHIASGEAWEDTFPLRGADGTFRWFLSRARPMRDAGGDVVRWFGTNTDISAQRELEQSVRASEQRFRTLTEAVPQMVWTADPSGEVTSFNKRWEEYTGVPLDAGRRTGWENGPVHPDDADRLRARWQLAVTGGAAGFSEEFRLRRASDGAHRWMLSVAVPLRGATGAVAEWVGTLTDIEDQKQRSQTLAQMVRRRTAELEDANAALTHEVAERAAAEARVRAVATELERSNDELEKFAYVASHDLQEPLRKIQAFGDRLQTKCRDQLPENGKEYVDRMLVAAGRMRRLIDDLLTFSRVTTQRRPFARVDLEKLVREVVSDLEVRLAQTSGTVVVGTLPRTDADFTQMRQLFQNLIANAVKFHKPGVPPVVEVSGELVRRPPGGPEEAEPVPVCRIRVRDNGIGFDEKYRDRIFDVFQRLHGRDEYEGTGVGLAICRKIVERHGGTITAHSRVGEGATFVVELPAYQSDTNEVSESNAPEK